MMEHFKKNLQKEFRNEADYIENHLKEDETLANTSAIKEIYDKTIKQIEELEV